MKQRVLFSELSLIPELCIQDCQLSVLPWGGGGGWGEEEGSMAECTTQGNW